MGQQLKRWESPRREGRNDKGKGGSARQRQLKKRQQMLRQKLQDNSKNTDKGRDFKIRSLLFVFRFAQTKLKQAIFNCDRQISKSSKARSRYCP